MDLLGGAGGGGGGGPPPARGGGGGGGGGAVHPPSPGQRGCRGGVLFFMIKQKIIRYKMRYSNLSKNMMISEL
jgi:hypothetical protein